MIARYNVTQKSSARLSAQLLGGVAPRQLTRTTAFGRKQPLDFPISGDLNDRFW